MEDGPPFGYSQDLMSFWISTNKTLHHNAYVVLRICVCSVIHSINNFLGTFLESSKLKLDCILNLRNLKANWLHLKYIWPYNEGKRSSKRQHTRTFLYKKHEFYTYVFDHFQSQSQFWIIWSGESQLSMVHKAPTWKPAELHEAGF